MSQIGIAQFKKYMNVDDMNDLIVNIDAFKYDVKLPKKRKLMKKKSMYYNEFDDIYYIKRRVLKNK